MPYEHTHQNTGETIVIAILTIALMIIFVAHFQMYHQFKLVQVQTKIMWAHGPCDREETIQDVHKRHGISRSMLVNELQLRVSE